MPAFSRPIASRSRAEVLGVVDVDAGDHRAVGVEGVDRVEAPAEADLEDHQVERRRREQARDRQQRELEVGQRDVAARALDRLEVRQQRRRRRPRWPPMRQRSSKCTRCGLRCAGRRGSRLPARSPRASRRSSPCRWCRRRRSAGAPKARPSRSRLTDATRVEREVDRLRVQALAVREPVGERRRGSRCRCAGDGTRRRQATASAL